MTKKLGLFISVLALSLSAFADANLKDAMLGQVALTQQMFDSIYAPADWDRSYNHWNFAEQIQSLDNWIQQTPNPSLKDFQRQLTALMYSTKDYHVSIHYDWTEAATLPFKIRGTIDGHYFLVAIDRTALSKNAFPLDVGDEVLTFGGQPIGDVIAQIRDRLGHNVLATDTGIAELYLTNRKAALGEAVPQGALVVTGRSHTTGKILSATVNWNYTPETVTPETNLRNLDLQSIEMHLANHSFHDQLASKKMVASRLPFLEQAAMADSDHWTIGQGRSFLPALGKLIWEETSVEPYMYAYIYQTPGGHNVGYIRIPSFDSPDNSDLADYFGQLIQKMETSTDALILDEVNNPGGSVFYVYALLSHLSPQPMQLPKHLVKLTQADIVAAQTMVTGLRNIKTDDDAQNAFGKSVDGYPATIALAQSMEKFSQSEIAAWQAKQGLTTAIPFQLAQVQPQAGTTYSKPILVLVNQLDFSGADFFPAILQDNKRATIMGTRTAGAGGVIDEIKFPNQLGIESMSLTETLALRLGNEPIESLGVTPDVPYTLTTNDFENGFTGYMNAVNQEIDHLIAK